MVPEPVIEFEKTTPLFWHESPGMKLNLRPNRFSLFSINEALQITNARMRQFFTSLNQKAVSKGQDTGSPRFTHMSAGSCQSD